MIGLLAGTNVHAVTVSSKPGRLNTIWRAQEAPPVAVAKSAPKQAPKQEQARAPRKILKIAPARRQASNSAKREIAERRTPRESYVERALDIANDVAPDYNIPVVAMVAMAVHETGYGRSELARCANAHFGIKADGRRWHGAVYWPGDGCKYRAYGSMRESFLDYAKFLSGGPRYARAFRYKDPKEFVRPVTRAGYCPSSEYMSCIAKIILDNSLGGS